MASKLVVLGLLMNLLVFADAQVGVCNGRVGDSLPSEQDVVTFYQTNGITRMRIYDPNQATLRALQALQVTNIELILNVPNDALQSLIDRNAATTWVQNNIQNHPDVRFRYIVVGNEVEPNTESGRYAGFVLPAMRNLHAAIRDAGLNNQIKISTVTYTGLLSTSFPPSTGTFSNNVVGFIEPIIRFLAENNLPVLTNIYPYFGYLGDPKGNLPYALFTAPGTVVNDNGLQYLNLFTAMLDAHYEAQARVGGENVEIVVSESGWPSTGGRGATVENARTYNNNNLIRHVKGTIGSPRKPGRSIETYIFAMFDENQKPGAETEKHFGLFSPNRQPKYQVNF